MRTRQLGGATQSSAALGTAGKKLAVFFQEPADANYQTARSQDRWMRTKEQHATFISAVPEYQGSRLRSPLGGNRFLPDNFCGAAGSIRGGSIRGRHQNETTGGGDCRFRASLNPALAKTFAILTGLPFAADMQTRQEPAVMPENQNEPSRRPRQERHAAR